MSPDPARVTVTVPPGGVNLTAFEIRLSNIWVSRVWSANIGSKLSGATSSIAT